MESRNNSEREAPARITATLLISERFVYRFATFGIIIGMLAIATALAMPLFLGVK